nr:transposon TX1 [Tanacetum cinerariifolium]
MARGNGNGNELESLEGGFSVGGKVGNVNAFSIAEMFSPNGNVEVPKFSSHLWQAAKSRDELALALKGVG